MQYAIIKQMVACHCDTIIVIGHGFATMEVSAI